MGDLKKNLHRIILTFGKKLFYVPAKSQSSQETKENSDQSRGSRESSESRDGSYYKNKYDMSVFSGENSDDSKELDLAQYYKQKYANSKSDGSRSSSSSSSSSSEEDEHPVVPLDKRVPEQPEETIDITSLSDGDDLDLTNLISEGGLEDLPEYKESHNKLVPEPSKVLKADVSTVFTISYKLYNIFNNVVMDTLQLSDSEMPYKALILRISYS